MTEILKKEIAELNLDRSEWQLVKFGDVAIQQKQTVDRESTELTRYVKGEHMYSEDLHLREWGELTDEYLGPAFIRKFEEGDILYGSRRTYLRKVVVAPFGGITSNTTFVIKANEGKLDNRLLPFIMLSEGFAQHSIKNSKGSVNPYVNWKDLSDYELLLPPKAQQEALAQLLWSMDEVIEKDLCVEQRVRLKLSTEAVDVCFRNLDISRSTYKISDIVDSITSGVSVNSTDDEYAPGEVAVLKTSAITGDEFKSTEAKVVLDSNRGLLKEPIKANSILINRKNTKGLVGSTKFIEEDFKNLFLPDLIWNIQVNSEKAYPQFIWYMLNTPQLRTKMTALSNGTNDSMVNISKKSFVGIEVSLPDKKIQKSFLDKAEQLSTLIKQIRHKLDSSKSLKKSIINQVL